MNPTLSARLRDWQRDPYWRAHPPAPWLVPVEPATALLHQSSMPAVAHTAGIDPTVPQTAGSRTEQTQQADFQLAASATAVSPNADGSSADDQLSRCQAMTDQRVVDQEVALREAPLSRGATRSADVEAAPADRQARQHHGAVSRDIDALGTNWRATVAWKAGLEPDAERTTAGFEAAELLDGAVTTDEVPNGSGQAAMSTIQSVQLHQLRQLIGVLIFGLVSLMEGWQAMRQLFQQIRAIWWAPTTAERAAALQLQPGIPVAIGVCGEASR